MSLHNYLLFHIKTRASCFIRAPKHLETIKAFISFSVFGTPDKTFAPICDILHQCNECEGFTRGSKLRETDENTRPLRPSAFIVLRCLEPLMKYEARIFDMASQSIFCRITVISYWIVLFTKLVCKLFKVCLVVNFLEVIACACVRWMQVQP